MDSHPRPGAGPRRRLLLATTNPAKQRELSRLLADLPIELVGPDALGGEPGVRSARWLGREASDEELIAATLRRMHGLPPERRGAALRLVVALVLPDGREVLGEGVIRGVIAEQATNGRERGFPFRSVFYLPSLGKYYLDLTGEEHERINHRRAALVPVRAALERYAAVPGT